ncbi:MAG: homoserine kinase [Notoacmeibacter sp.]|nr:homoserine kinase [Notoacmeibacter sp.]MCC0033030.1 homoserine kinase [Brucellaceae bacterium]
MAVYTDISEEELEAFLSAYPVGRLLSYRGIAEGVENSNFMLHAEGGSFILTLFEKRTNEQDLPFFTGLMDHLAGKGLTCPQPVKRSDGAIIGRLAGRPAIIVSFLEGMWPRRPTAAHCREVGAALARMHLAAADFPVSRANGLALKDWRPLFDLAAARADEVEPGLAGEVAAELDVLEASWPQGLPAGVIHADLFPDNVFFLGEKLSGLIDFYFACNDVLAYDVAVCLNAWCFERDFSFNLTKGQALLAGYQSVRPLSAGEMQALPLLARGAAIRFLLTRLYDWLNTPAGAVVTKKDPREYLRRLRFHRQVISAVDYGAGPA